jgi:hypothetical protein
VNPARFRWWLNSCYQNLFAFIVVMLVLLAFGYWV